MRRFVVLIVFSLVALGFSGGDFQAFAQHIHLVAGITTTLEPDRTNVTIVNAGSFDINSYEGVTPSCFFMTDNDPFLYPGLYHSDVTFAALPATLWTGGPAPAAAAKGAFIVARIATVAGPAGGEFSLWQENDDATAAQKLFTIPTGTTNSAHQFNVSEGITFPEPDPFGHIHGRRFTVNKPGLYTVGFQMRDTSTSHVDGTPVHSPGHTNYFYFQAGVFISDFSKTNNVARFRFGAQFFHDYHIDYNDNLSSTNWVKFAEVIGANHSDVHTIVDTNATGPARFYRLREFVQ
ncbi:MAG TPA: hypothetical protein PKA41_03765 [Verrucomicrobiota bacterium]|nr:hypothetical protein [Verrucomicrobiota bacterium]